MQEILQQEAKAILNIPINDQYEKAVSLIIAQVHEKKGKLVTSGMGKAGQIAMNIATTFCSTGIPANGHRKPLSVFIPEPRQKSDLWGLPPRPQRR